MSFKIVILIAGAAVLAGAAFGYFLRLIVSLGKKGSMELEIKQMLLDAKENSQKILKEAEKTAQEKAKEIIHSAGLKETELKRHNERLIKKEEFLDKRQLDIDKEIDGLKLKIEEIKDAKNKLTELEKAKSKELERVASLSTEQARDELIREVERQFEEDMAVRIQKLDTIANERIERRAKEILTTAIHRFGNSVAADVLSTTVAIPSDDVKGKIIGKEGRNIKSFERATGVEVIVDDTPGIITLSSFDPVRRQVARLALENLILDGRIQPARIEDIVEKARQEANKIIKEKGEQAAYEAGIYNIDSRLLSVLGRLHFRTSYGQNVLQHSTEMAHIAGMIAEELGADVQVAKMGALFHDIGKALDHEVQGTRRQNG
jgi:ribonuclease Y